MSNLMMPIVGQELEDALRQFCVTSEPGTAIMPERELARQYEVTVATVRRVMKELLEDGLISRQQGRGTFVAEMPRSSKGTKQYALYVDMWEDSNHPHHLGLLRGLVSEAAACQLRLEVLECGQNFADEHRVIEALADGSVAGLVVPWMTAGIVEACKRLGPLPVVTTASPNVFGKSSYVGPDLAAIGAGSRSILQEYGCQRPVGVFVSGVARGSFLQTGEKADTWQGILPVQSRNRDVGRWTEQLLELEPDGLAFDDDVIATEMMEALEFPEWPIVSLTDSNARGLPESAMRLEVNSVQMGQEIMRLLRRLLDHPGTPHASHLLRPIRVNPPTKRER